MKTIFTPIVLLCTLFSLISKNSQSQSAPSVFQYNFSGTPILLSGADKQVNAKYRFSSVSSGVDAIVTIVSATGGATLSLLDDNAISKPEGFSPQVQVPSGTTGLIEFNIKFVIAGTETIKVQDSLYATAIDIDGNANLKEIDVIDMGGGSVSYLSGTLEIQVTQSGTAFTGKNIGGNEYTSIDTAAKQVMFTVKKNNVGQFTYKCGAQNNGSSVARQKSIYFKNFTYAAGGPLPVKYSSFDATVEDKAVSLKWVTEQELNHDRFEVQRSFDANNFKTIGLVLDAEISNGASKTYRFKDNSVELQGRAIVYYRLKQIDISGGVSYSVILAVKLQAKAGVNLQVAPNPFVEKLYVRFTSNENGNAQIRIINISGQPVLTKQSGISKGYNTLQVDGLSQLPTGVYVAEVAVNGVIIDKQKVVKN